MGIRRGSLWGTVAIVCLMAAVYLLYEPPVQGRTQTANTIDLSAEVEASQCAPCHVRIASSRKPGLIFDHGMHLVVTCSACHYEMPHQGGTTFSPPMESCFNCHGLQHGPQGELARANCSACHTKSFKLRPDTHKKGWEGKPHAERGRSEVNSCLMCHNKPEKDCDACHTREDVRRPDGKPIGPMPKSYQPVAPIRVKKASVKVYPDQPTTMGQCISCHPDLDSFDKKRGVIFAHAEHLRRDYKCTVCHPVFGHGAETINRPPMETCYKCHGLVHAESGIVAGEECGKCHPKDFNLKPANHTPSFVAKGHTVRAKDDAAYCVMCHKPEFCVECHQGRRRLASGKLSTVAVPAEHKKAEFMGKHGGQFLQQKGVCGACHDSASCSTCHWSPMPHPVDWLAQHGQETDKIDKKVRDCNVCHTNRERCQQCHHDTVKRAELKAENCTKCHDEMERKPYTSIKHKGFAEHAVHFDVKKTKGEYYTCDDCHVGFGTGGTGQKQAKLEQGHDLRLCYGCHGALDFEQKRIAPYSGAELCLRCHQDLNI